MNGTSTITISDLRQNAAAAVNAVSTSQKPTIILQRSRPKAVLVDINYFQSLEEAVLDLTDAREADRAKTEARTPFTGYVKKRWGKRAP
ncbi:type II toxin-antitoxin system Phd/YefM family antitoxin [Patescibacteria group bacterium]|nr:type II toxin-antitoxin system Phd/YefM family antitoxin [Patescibacteria group bacterium]MBU1472865.1 type II toxin-antitoxin system Phd/YefM family antitoxin [Patescibacteria group bacterium]MBU2459522.1 type II toxin-antitoxin system Phd/YefM family antitoxin [Patescibacteria group bacterium]MBU2543971.1 type II toxin-antitoxin system Phd/YefM family antitoxin [Patescibacteria group bacterium]